jgi:soluble lytic murein transglycosylase-like protein
MDKSLQQSPTRAESKLVRGILWGILVALTASLYLNTKLTPPTYEAPLEVVADYNREVDVSYADFYSIPLSLAQQIRAAAQLNSIPLSIAYSLVRHESNFDSLAVSWAGARGLTQVMPATGLDHCGLDADALFHAQLNLQCGFSFLRMLYEPTTSAPLVRPELT